jgi:hypothetical protein
VLVRPPGWWAGVVGDGGGYLVQAAALGFGSLLLVQRSALVVVSVAGTLLQQSAFQAGELGASLPTMIVGEPVVAVVIGAVVLQEELRANGAEWALVVVLVAVMVAATTALARSSAQTTTAVVVARPARA